VSAALNFVVPRSEFPSPRSDYSVSVNRATMYTKMTTGMQTNTIPISACTIVELS
jgi:hypothetical protein